MYRVTEILTAVCLCLMLAHQAEAGSIVWSGVQDIEYPFVPPLDVNIDLDLNGVDDFMIRRGGVDAWAYSLVDGNEFFCTTDEEPDKYPPAARPESSGTLIAASPVAPKVWYDDTFEGYGQIMMHQGNGYWVGTDHQYMGVRFFGGSDLYYGWIEMSIEPDMPNPMTIHSWAYNSVPGEGLVAGVVPEPSSIALLLCGGLAVIGMHRRKRK